MAFSPHRAAEPIGVVEALNGRLAARAQASTTDGIQGVALYFLDGGDFFSVLLAVSLEAGWLIVVGWMVLWSIRRIAFAL